MHPIWKRSRSEKVNTERDFCEVPIRKVSEISIWVDFFRPKFLPFLGDHHGCTGGKERSGKYPTQPEKSGPTGGVFHPLLAPRFSACVSPFQKRFFPWIYPQWPSTNSSNFNGKKLTHAEISMASQRHLYLSLCQAISATVCFTCMYTGWAPFGTLNTSGSGHVSGSKMVTLT